jgi:[acyl-carrier-protein] S-malonyltransferase
MKNIVYSFDGQGAFRAGVGKDLCTRYPEAHEIITQSSAILGFDLSEHLWGDKAQETSNLTSIAQPAISAVSLAYAAVLKKMEVVSTVSLGHSLGEITAIVYCGIVSFEDGMKLIQKRGELMERGGKEGTMMAVINMPVKELDRICTDIAQDISQPLVVANINTPNQIVVSGSKEGAQRAAQVIAKEHGRCIPLKVGGAWHSPYLKDASNEFAGFIDTIEFKKPEVKFYSVVEQKILDDPMSIKDSIKKQMLSRVDWVSAIKNLVGLKYNQFLEIGPSKILKDLVAKIAPDVHVNSTALYADMHELIQAL